MIRVGYLEGTDPLFLNELSARGVDTMPLSNGVDSHGKRIDLLTVADQVSLVVGYLYKVVPLAGSGRTAMDVLRACHIHETPVVIIAQRTIHASALEVLGEARTVVTLADPSELRSVFERMVG